MADTPDEPSQPDEPSESDDAADAESGADDAADAESGSDGSGRDATSSEAQSATDTSDEAEESTAETLDGASLPGPAEEDGAPSHKMTDDELGLLGESERPDRDEGDDEDADESTGGLQPADDDEPTGGLQRVDDTHEPGSAASEDSADSVGLPGPSMETRPVDEPSSPEDRDHVAEHVADAPYADDPEAAERGGQSGGDPDGRGENAGAPEPVPAPDEIDEHPPEPQPSDKYPAGSEPPEEYHSDPEPIGPNDAETSAPMAEPGMAADAGTSSKSFMDAPPDDEEMPLTEHIEEMVLRLSAVAVSAAVVAIVFYAGLVNDFIPELWYHIHPGSVEPCKNTPNTPFAQCAPPHVYSPVEYFLTKLKLSGLAGLIVALPVGVYQTYLFMKPGLYPKERRYYLASVPLSLVLALMGVAFATFVILPLLFEYFLTYSADTVSIAFQLKDTMNLMLVLMGWLAVIFQIPLLMMLGVMMGITSRAWMASRRIYFWGGFGAIAFFFGAVDPTGVAPILLTLTMIVLFEVTLLLLRWVGR